MASNGATKGKGKIVDVLAPQYQVVARFQGGPNAGHTLEFDGIKHVLHQIPSGIFRSDIQNIIGNGVVLDPIVFRREIEALQKFNLDLHGNLFISKKLSIILPTHSLLDAAYERAKGDDKIGSTLRGIGPTYQDKIARLGLRAGDLLLLISKTSTRSWSMPTKPFWTFTTSTIPTRSVKPKPASSRRQSSCNNFSLWIVST